MKNIEVTVTLKMLAGNESEEGNDNDKFDDLMDDLVTNGSFEELGGWLEGLASSLDTLMKGFELMNYIREAQTGVTVTEAKVEVKAECCKYMDKKNDWISITTEGFWEDTTGQSLLTP